MKEGDDLVPNHFKIGVVIAIILIAILGGGVFIDIWLHLLGN